MQGAIESALAQLVHVFGVDANGSVNHEEVELVVLERLLEEVGGVRGVHVYGCADGNRHGGFDLLGHVEEQAAA